MTGKVTVIIPVYNGGKYLFEALESAVAQDYPELEIIVADDGSTDDSAAIAESFDGVRCLRLERGGVSRARNLAVAASTGEWLAFLDADDLWMANKISAQVSLESNPGSPGLILCEREYLFEGGPPAWFRAWQERDTSTSYEPSAWLLRRTVFDTVGGFDEARAIGEDTEWLARAWDLGIDYAIYPAPLLRRRIHDSNATGTIESPRKVVFAILRESIARKHARGAELD